MTGNADSRVIRGTAAMPTIERAIGQREAGSESEIAIPQVHRPSVYVGDVDAVDVETVDRQKTAANTMVSLSFKVPLDFRLRFKMEAVRRGISMTELLEQAVAHLGVRHE